MGCSPLDREQVVGEAKTRPRWEIDMVRTLVRESLVVGVLVLLPHVAAAKPPTAPEDRKTEAVKSEGKDDDVDPATGERLRKKSKSSGKRADRVEPAPP
jgi:hypothetical protein